MELISWTHHTTTHVLRALVVRFVINKTSFVLLSFTTDEMTLAMKSLPHVDYFCFTVFRQCETAGDIIIFNAKWETGPTPWAWTRGAGSGVVGGKGGVGKTTTSCCLGTQLAKHRKKVRFVLYRIVIPIHTLSIDGHLYGGLNFLRQTSVEIATSDFCLSGIWP